MNLALLLLLTNLKLSFDAFSLWELKKSDYLLLLRPNIVWNYSAGEFRFFFDGSYNYIKTRDTLQTEAKLYQSYIKFQKGNFESKLGKLVHIPGFAGIFNPYYKAPSFENISTSVEGETGIFLRVSHHILTPLMFLIFTDQWKEIRLKLQAYRRIGSFETGLYAEPSRSSAFGVYGGYFGKITLKFQGLKKDSIAKLCANIEFPFRTTITSIWMYTCTEPEFFPLPGAFLLTKNILALEIRFPEKVFEIPYLLLFYDLDSRVPLFIFDYKYIVSNNLLLEGGVTTRRQNRTLYPSVYGGLRFTKGF